MNCVKMIEILLNLFMLSCVTLYYSVSHCNQPILLFFQTFRISFNLKGHFFSLTPMILLRGTVKTSLSPLRL